MTRPVLVVGDSMLDRYWIGTADRLSPEAPVPVLLMQESTSRAGGAANVALNLARLGCSAQLVTLLGDDEAGRELLALLDGVEVYAVRTTATAEKIRAVSRRHQLLRIDTEHRPPEGAARDVARLASAALRAGGWVVLSDYAKGALAACAAIIQAARASGCRVLVDPKGNDFTRYRGAWLLKPNEDEFRAVAGDWTDSADLARRAQAMRTDLQLEHLLITCGASGMLLFSDGESLGFKAEAREVFDVSGAGDTVIATLAAMLARGHGLHASVRMANRAAGIVVGRFGTSAVTLQDLGL